MHCDDPGCLKACPAPGAIVQYANGIVDFIRRTASAAAIASPAARSTSRASRKNDHKAYKCTLVLRPRGGRAGAGLRQDLPDRGDRVRHQGRHDELRRRTHRRPEVARLRQRRAYDPPGVGGTHVMYVLHHADKPELYADLPKDPKISPLVEAVERRHQICRHGVDRRLRGFGLLPLHVERPEPGNRRR